MGRRHELRASDELRAGVRRAARREVRRGGGPAEDGAVRNRTVADSVVSIYVLVETRSWSGKRGKAAELRGVNRNTRREKMRERDIQLIGWKRE